MRHSVGGVNFNLMDEGEGQVILFLHGLGGCWRDWHPQLDMLRERYRCVVIEHRGHGRSEATSGRYSTALFARDALAICDRIGVEHAHVVGLSMGGQIAQHIAIDRPDVVDTLVLCNTGAYMPKRMGEALLALAREVRVHGFTDTHGDPSSAAAAWSAATLAERPDLIRDNQREAQSTDPGVWASAARAIVEHDTRADLGRITAPTLIVQGEEDGLILPDKAAPALQEGIPHAELVRIPNAGHLVNLEQAEAFNAIITGFFDRHPVRDRAGAGAAAG